MVLPKAFLGFDMSTNQETWDRLLVANFWPCFIERRSRCMGHLAITYRTVSGDKTGTPERFPESWSMRFRVSKFVCSRLPALANRIIDCDGVFDMDEMIAFAGSLSLSKSRHMNRSDKSEIINTSRDFSRFGIVCESLRRNGEDFARKPGGTSGRVGVRLKRSGII